MTVADILRRRGWGVITIDASAPVSAVIGIMRRERVTALAVSSDGHHVDGIVTERDIIGAFRLICLEGLMQMPVRAAMSRSVTTCRPDESLRRVMARLAAKRARHAIVLDAGGIWGIVSMAEIIEHRLEEAEQEVETATGLYLVAS